MGQRPKSAAIFMSGLADIRKNRVTRSSARNLADASSEQQVTLLRSLDEAAGRGPAPRSEQQNSPAVSGKLEGRDTPDCKTTSSLHPFLQENDRPTVYYNLPRSVSKQELQAGNQPGRRKHGCIPVRSWVRERGGIGANMAAHYQVTDAIVGRIGKSTGRLGRQGTSPKRD